MAQQAPFQFNPVYTGIAIRYTNESFIADMVMPRATVGKSMFKYQKFVLEETFRVPSTAVGRKSRPNKVEFTATEVTDSTKDYGLDDDVPQEDIDNAAGVPNMDPLALATTNVTELVALDREVRVAGIVQTASNYSQSTDLAGTGNQVSNPDSDPIGMFEDALDAMIVRANIAVIGNGAWRYLKVHPDLVQAMYGSQKQNAATKGMISAAWLADFLELDAIYIGKGWQVTSKKGQSVTTSRIWGKHISLLRVNPNAGAGAMPTWGFTAQFGSKVAGTIADPHIGLRGGQIVRVGERVKEVVSATDLGYFLKNAA